MGDHDDYGANKFPPLMARNPGKPAFAPPWAVYHFDRLERRILLRLELIMVTQTELAAKIATLTQGVADETTVIDGLDLLLTNLAKMIADLKTQVANADVPQAIADSIDAIGSAVANNKARIIKDVTDNTPAA